MSSKILANSFMSGAGVSLFLLLGCGDGQPVSSSRSAAEMVADPSPATDAVSALPLEETSSTAALGSPVSSGVWAKLLVLSSETSALGVGSKAKIARYSLVTFTAGGATVAAVEQPCFVNTVSSGATKLSFPEQLVTTLSASTYFYNVVTEAQGTSLIRENGVEALGVRFDNQWLDSLPTASSDPRLVDQDRDGNPGVTVKIEAKVIFTIKADLYVAQRSFWTESTKLVNESTITGNVSWTQEQLVLGSTNPLFTGITPTVTTLPDESFVMLRKIPDTSDCADVKKQENLLFPPVNI